MTTNKFMIKYQNGDIVSDSTRVNKFIPKLKPKFSEVTKELFKSPNTRNAEAYLSDRDKNIESQKMKNNAKNLVRAGLETLPITSTAANLYGVVENAAKGNYVDAASYTAGLLPIPGSKTLGKQIIQQGLKRFNQLGTVNTATGKSFNDYEKGGILKLLNNKLLWKKNN